MKRFIVSVMLFILALFFIGSSSCSYIKEPKMLEEETWTCYYARYCNHSNQKNPDKSNCVRGNSSCNAISVSQWCMKNEDVLKRFNVDFQTCLDKHNK